MQSNDINDFYKELRTALKQYCDCGNNRYLSLSFHRPHCAFLVVANDMWENFLSKEGTTHERQTN